MIEYYAKQRTKLRGQWYRAGQRVPATPHIAALVAAGVVEARKTAPVRVRKAPPVLSSVTVAELGRVVRKLTSRPALLELLSAERMGKARVTALRAIESRLQEVE